MELRAHRGHHPENTEQSLRAKRDPKCWEVWGHSSGISSALNFMHCIWYFSRMLGLRCCVPWWDKREHKPDLISGISSNHHIAWGKDKTQRLYSFPEGLIFLHFHPTPIFRLFSDKSKLQWNQISGIPASSLGIVAIWHQKVLYLLEVNN